MSFSSKEIDVTPNGNIKKPNKNNKMTYYILAHGAI